MSDIEFMVAIITAAGVVVSAPVYLAGRRAAQDSTTVDLLREFHSPEISHARGLGEHAIRKQAEVFGPSRRQEGRELRRERRNAIHTIGRFFARVNMLRETGNVNSTKLCRFFIPHFAYWWGLYFESRKEELDWTLRKDLVELHDWFAFEAQKYRDWRLDWEKWLEIGRKVRVRSNAWPTSERL